MNKLQYDSFYKFIVSVGIILITAPILGIYYYFTGSYDILITKQEFAELSDFSLQALNNRIAISKIISFIFPWVCFILIALGIFCVIYGCRNWHKIQTDLDEQTHLDTEMKRINAKQLTPTEVAERTINEILEDSADETSSHKNDNPQNIIVHSRYEAMVRGLRAENMFYEYICKKLNKHYDIKQNIRIGETEYDIVAISTKNDTDYIFEIKAWNNPISMALYRRILAQLKSATENYKHLSNRKVLSKLIIVSQSTNVEAMKSQFANIKHKPNTDFDYQIEIYSEEELA